MIEFKDVVKVFDGKDTVRALNGISLRIPDKTIYGIIGFSGAGKSTLLRMINALETPTSGTVLVNNTNVSTYRGNALRAYRKSIGMIFQQFNILESKDVFGNVALPLVLNNAGKSQIEERVTELLDFVGLTDKRNASPAELSGGQKQRTGIARALSTNPSILLCDEATSALDPKTTESILELLKTINRELGVTIVMITHQMEVIRKICTNVAVIEQGRIVEDGTVREVFGNPQQQITKDFVRTVINDTLPPSLLEKLSKYPFPQKVLRLRFEGGNADDPVISDTVKKFSITISILFSTVTELQDSILGYQTVQITGSADEIKKAEAYLSERNVGIQEVAV